jgi:serine protease
MGKIKIGLIIFGLIALMGLVVTGVGMAKNGSNNGKAEYVPDEIIVKFKGDVKPFRVIKVPEGKVGEKIKEYLKRGDVEYAEPNYLAYALWTPNDPYYRYQWHLDNPEYGGIQMEEAWELLGAPGNPGLGVSVAVVDTGIRKGTDLLKTCFVPGYDFVNNDSDPTDDNGHGTHVAGTVAQSTNNALGVAGVAFKSCLMPVKVLDARGAGTYANVADGIRYAADNGAKVINLSLGGSSPSATLEEALAYAYGKGVTIVAAAGNDGAGGAPSYPAAYDDYVIAVGATQYDETRAPYSTTGSYLDLVAPGGNTSLDQNNDGYGDGVLQQTFKIVGRRITWSYYFFQGTSMAAPHVSGVAALLLAKGNTTTPDEVRAALQETAEGKGTPGWDEAYGWGLVDAYAALQWRAR